MNPNVGQNEPANTHPKPGAKLSSMNKKKLRRGKKGGGIMAKSPHTHKRPTVGKRGGIYIFLKRGGYSHNGGQSALRTPTTIHASCNASGSSLPKAQSSPHPPEMPPLQLKRCKKPLQPKARCLEKRSHTTALAGAAGRTERCAGCMHPTRPKPRPPWLQIRQWGRNSR